ncbi:hypothetical protein [Klebsiella pneumoniae]|uniref:hypothetical protein n=1 Tax=Klebsiella pneumoniae TaxID=573 RepID=UPI00200F6436|nr:hypothetical protein [Klebsiella pneumoniae]MCL0782289.1 hypothetical protein [Klebsiella pneumoniae]
MRTIEELGKRAALLKWKRQFGPFEKCPVCYGFLLIEMLTVNWPKFYWQGG